MEIQAEAAGIPDLLPAKLDVIYNPPGQWVVLKYWYYAYFLSEYRTTDAPFADSPYLCGSKLIEVTPSGMVNIFSLPV